jgi:quinol monooxygenase YgiN
MSIRIARFHVEPQHLDRAALAIEEFTRSVGEREPGTLRYESFRDANGGFVHVMEFVDAAAELAHRGTEHVRRFVDVLYPLCDEKPTFTDMTPVAQAHRRHLD